jgi:serine/threonine protein kinase
MWPGVTKMDGYCTKFPQFTNYTLHQVPKLAEDERAFNLLQKILLYNPTDRITALDALDHPWFK